MTEFDYDVRERKQLARQAKYKKNGSKSKKCTLRQDHMTSAQLKKLNGKVIKFNMNQPIRSWAEFKALSKESAREYISSLSEKYGASIGDFARMFGVTYNPVKTYFGTIGATASAGRMPADNVSAWMEFLGGTAVNKDEKEVVDDPRERWVDDFPATESEHCVHKVKPSGRPEMRMRDLTLTFSGDINLVEVANSLRLILGKVPRGDLIVDFKTWPYEEF